MWSLTFYPQNAFHNYGPQTEWMKTYPLEALQCEMRDGLEVGSNKLDKRIDKVLIMQD